MFSAETIVEFNLIMEGKNNENARETKKSLNDNHRAHTDRTIWTVQWDSENETK